MLKDYLENDASVLKSGTWLPIKEGEEAQPATNLSGFNGQPIGMFVDSYQSAYEGKYLSYWALDNVNTGIDTKAFYLKSDLNTIEEAVARVEQKAYAIRCIRK